MNWQSLNLNEEQLSEIHALEQDWRTTYDQLSPQINKDKQRLLQMMKTPNANEKEMMRLQNHLHDKESQLRQKATSTVYQKRKVLNEKQMKHYLEFMNHAAP